ncbi:glutathione S-transferase family protein [Cupriavidus basilensis]|uniref:glutathione S-transferase family protein n=1 Tax=Cupriavidus basilensis TaxID=68895 RepID=UPI0039F6D4C2
MPQPELILFHSPNTRSTSALILLEELGVPYRLHPLNMKAGEQREPAYLAINPMGKVPAIRYGDALVTEQAAVFIFLADLFPQARLAPALTDPLRGPYLRWMVFHGSCFEPALVDHSQQRETPRAMCPYGDYDTTIGTLLGQLEKGPYLLGDTFTAADVLWGTVLTWTTMFKLVEATPVVQAYIDRINARPAVARARAIDAKLAAEQGG